LKLSLNLGLIQRKERWVLTVRGWVLLCAVLISGSAFGARKANAFLSVTCRIQADALVLEGWLPDYALEQALNEFTNGHYGLLITAGGPLPKGAYLSEYQSNAEFAAATLRKMGLDSERLVSVPAPKTTKDRTYVSALAVKAWLTASHSNVHAMNVFTVGPHARRSRLLFQKAFGDEVAVGVISGPDEEYDQRHWWTTSAGVRTVLDEVIAYLYAKFLFHPSQSRLESRAINPDQELDCNRNGVVGSRAKTGASETSEDSRRDGRIPAGDPLAGASVGSRAQRQKQS